MADLTTYTSRFRANPVARKVTKRPREPLVCIQCRRSKLRCDRGRPCSSCVKRSEADICSYTSTSTSSSVDSGNGDRKSAAEERLLHLESMVKYLMQTQSQIPTHATGNGHAVGDITSRAAAKPNTPPVLPDDPPQSAADRPQSGPKPDDTRYVGSTHWSAILDDIQELRAVVMGNPTLIQETEEIIPPPPVDSPPEGELIFGISRNYSLEKIIAQYLPPRVEVDRFVAIYFRGETFILPFVHSGQFQRQYRDFWHDPAKVNPLWLSILFSICYMASLTGGAPPSQNLPPRGTALQHDLVTGRSGLHTAAAQCLVVGEYHRPQQYAPEALCLYAHGKNMRSLDPSREAGAIFGMVVRMAYAMGYHRDPDSFGSCTVFEGEMRRRFWSLCKQMDLMVSFLLGLPSNICLDNCDTKPPRNLLDSDFDVDTQVLPETRSETEPTRLMWFIVKDRLMLNFSKVCRDALSFTDKSDAEVVQLDTEIRQTLSTIPDGLRARPIAESIADPPFLVMTRLYIDFISLKSLCVLHRRYMARGHPFSTRCCVEAGIRLVSGFLDMYKEFSPGGQLQMERWMLTNFTMNDFLLGVMVLCLFMHTTWKRPGTWSSLTPPIEGTTGAGEAEVLSLLEQSHAICIEQSSACRDAWRASHAVALTLKRAKSRGITSPQLSLSGLSQSSFSRPAIMSPEMDNLFDEHVPLAPRAVPSLSTTMRPSEEVDFGSLDPFSFLLTDLDTVDWMAFDP